MKLFEYKGDNVFRLSENDEEYIKKYIPLLQMSKMEEEKAVNNLKINGIPNVIDSYRLSPESVTVAEFRRGLRKTKIIRKNQFMVIQPQGQPSRTVLVPYDAIVYTYENPKSKFKAEFHISKRIDGKIDVETRVHDLSRHQEK